MRALGGIANDPRLRCRVEVERRRRAIRGPRVLALVRTNLALAAVRTASLGQTASLLLHAQTLL
jgi:hypothetical protein